VEEKNDEYLPLIEIEPTHNEVKGEGLISFDTITNN
jgi:hypothetical protein